MKQIKIDSANAAAIKAALAAVNGNATAHAYTEFSEIEAVAKLAQKRIEALGIAKARQAGAQFEIASGEAVPSAYKYTRSGTRVCLLRRAGGWYLTDVARADVYKEGGGRGTLRLTQAQADEAHKVLAAEFIVLA